MWSLLYYSGVKLGLEQKQDGQGQEIAGKNRDHLIKLDKKARPEMDF